MQVQAEAVDELELEVNLLEPTPKQKAFILSVAKRKVIRAGRRGGKTTGIAIYAVEKLLQGRRVLYGAPTTEQITRFWKCVTDSLADPIEAGLFRKNETEHVIELPGTEQRIRAKTAWNADTLRGDYADELILDEYQLMSEDAWETVGAPMLLDNNGNAVFIYTPPSLHSRSVSKARDKRHAAKLFKKAERDKSGRWAAFHFTSFDNPHLSQEALAEISQDMTALSMKQEIYAEDVDKMPGAMWDLELIERTRVPAIPEGVRLVRIVVGVDPTGGTAEAGIVVGALGSDGHGYVLQDGSLHGSPGTWGLKSVTLYNEFKGDRIVAEDNYGGEMVVSTIRSVEGGESVSLGKVHATRGKTVRAEPIAAKYERGIIHHVGTFDLLEEEMCVAEGTLISTLAGDIGIQYIGVGNSVLTRAGYKNVEAVFENGIREVITVHTSVGDLVCTENHPVYVCTRGFINAGNLRIGDLLICHSQSSESLSNSGAKSISRRTTVITKQVGLAEADCCIETSTNRFTENLLLEYSCITKKEKTTHPIIYRQSRGSSMQRSTEFLERSRSHQPFEAQREKKNGDIGNHERISVHAVKNSRASVTTPSIVPANVEIGRIIGITRNGISKPVFNLSISEAHEYFANGVLTHNCTYVPGGESPNRMDALVWAMTELMIGSAGMQILTSTDRITAEMMGDAYQ